MHSLCKTCPTCGSNDTQKFDHYCTILPIETIPHYCCRECQTIWGTGRPQFKKEDHGKQTA